MAGNHATEVGSGFQNPVFENRKLDLGTYNGGTGRAVRPLFSYLESPMVKNTVQRDEKRVIIYYTFDDEKESVPTPSAPSPQPSMERSDHE